MKKLKENSFEDGFSSPDVRKSWDEIAELRNGRDTTSRCVLEAAWRYLKEGSKILDIGPGTGKYVIALAARGIEVTPLDFSKKVHELIKEEKKEHDLKGEQIIADAVNLPYKDGSFDGAIFFRTVSFLKRDDVEKCLSEIERVLKNGGVLIAAFPSTKSDLYELGIKQFKSSKTVMLVGFERDGLSGLPRNFFDYEDFENYKKLLEKNFTVKEWRHETANAIVGGQSLLLRDWFLVAEKKV
ncbi:methyltransferase domain-containing protein [Candidatus Micrarchaeota archaeon]|nr:methyltransferase domain-containing protein [Candidatus Micrarchaeota archaeon]